MRDDLHLTAATRLKATQQRYTENRRALVEILSAASRPVAVDDILEQDRSLPQSSVYRNLAVLEHARVVRRVHGSDEFARYELAEDLSEHHHHLVCSNCGKVEDFEAPSGLERTVRKAMDAAELIEGFFAHGHRLDLVGLCRDCA
jgi:Fur family transcriptional regulator, ferric uptake regulator